jgi:hypothetical protein
MKTKKVYFILGIFLVLSILLSGCNDKSSKETIMNTVKENHEMLLQSIEQNDFSACNTISVIKDINSYNGYIEFYCGGAGMGGETSYCGFYYFENDDIPYVMDTMSIFIGGEKNKIVFVQEGGGYVWKDNQSDNLIYFEKIIDHFYYFEQEY